MQISAGENLTKESSVYRSIALRAGILAATLAVAILAFTMTQPAHRADAAGPACSFATPIQTLIANGGGTDTVTCTIDVHGTTHTLIVDFTVTLGAVPPVTVNGCSLDGNAIHVGRCP